MIRVDHKYEVHLDGHPHGWFDIGSEAAQVRIGLAPVATAIHEALTQTGETPVAGVLFAGPWIGEFGWELARWQGGIRKIASESDLYVIVMGDPGHELLYEYADEYWTVPEFFRAAGFTRQCDHIRGGNEARVHLELLGRLIAEELSSRGQVKMAITSRKFRPGEQTLIPVSPSVRRWSLELGDYFCILPRFRRWNPQKNWPVHNWACLMVEIADPSLEAVVAGTAAEVRKFRPDIELDDADALRRSVDLLSHARFAIASESGGALLSLLCGCPTVVFGHRSHEKRVTVTENFLNTPVSYVARPDYRHSVSEVVDALGQAQGGEPLGPEPLGPELEAEGLEAEGQRRTTAREFIQPS